MPIYLVHAPVDGSFEGNKEFAALFPEWCPLLPGFVLVESAASQSAVYHDIKWSLPEGTPLVVARLDHQPKFKGVHKGALAWVRERFDGMTA